MNGSSTMQSQKKNDGMSLNQHLIKAKTNKNDEFYTQLEDIEKELSHYTEQIQGQNRLLQL